MGQTYHKIKAPFHGRGLYRSVQAFVGSCPDCATGKVRPAMKRRSSGNIQATYPFQVIAMDHIPSLPISRNGYTELLIWMDLFTGLVIAKASSTRTAQQVAQRFEECVLRRFGSSEVIRHDRDPGFMADVFRAFNKILGQKQSVTIAYRPQANGKNEIMVQTMNRALKMYVVEADQHDWDEYAERLVFAINSSYDRVKGDTPFI